METKTAGELMDWLESGTNKTDKPRNFGRQEVEKIIEIALIEASGNSGLLAKKILDFKRSYRYNF